MIRSLAILLFLSGCAPCWNAHDIEYRTDCNTIGQVLEAMP